MALRLRIDRQPRAFSLGGLDETIDPLDEAIGDPAMEPAQDAVAVTFDGARGIDDRWQPTVGRPEVPLLEEDRRCVSCGLVIEFLECQPDAVCTGSPMHGRSPGQAINDVHQHAAVWPP